MDTRIHLYRQASKILLKVKVYTHISRFLKMSFLCVSYLCTGNSQALLKNPSHVYNTIHIWVKMLGVGCFICQNLVINTLYLRIIFNHLHNCEVKTKTIPGFAFTRRVKYVHTNCLYLFEGLWTCGPL